MIVDDKTDIRLFSRGAQILILLFTLGAVAAVYRLAAGLGSTANLSDTYPWGLWIGIDVMGGIALVAGGFAITGAVYIFNMTRYKPIAMPAILTSFIGYLIMSLAIFLDIGKPFSIWHPLVMWQPRSIMFWVVVCDILYMAVLFLEFAPALFERFNRPVPANRLRKKIIILPLVILDITLSYMHQSFLGGFFLITPTRLHPLWYTPLIPSFFLYQRSPGGSP